MKEENGTLNPFNAVGVGMDKQALRLEGLHERPVSESVCLQEGLLIMMSKLMEITRLVWKYGFVGPAAEMDACVELAREVHEQEKILTRDLVSSGMEGEIVKGLIRFPFRLERIGDMLESIINCCRIKAEDGIPFSDKAHAELDQMFGLLTEMMTNLREAFITPTTSLLVLILSQSKRLSDMLLDFRLAHWDRVEAGYCLFQASSMYLDMLDSLTAINEYLKKMARTLIDLDKASSTSQEVKA